MPKKFKPYINVNVVYEGYDPSFDAKLRAIAKKYNSFDCGSGCGLGERDLDFEFTDLNVAAKFVKDVYKLDRIKHVYSKSHLYDNDYKY